LIGPPWTGGTGPQAPVHEPASPPASAWRQLASARQIAACHVAPPPLLSRSPRNFCKKNPAVSKITNIPFHLYKSHSSRSLFLCFEP
jgi:hypothetical protein